MLNLKLILDKDLHYQNRFLSVLRICLHRMNFWYRIGSPKVNDIYFDLLTDLEGKLSQNLGLQSIGPLLDLNATYPYGKQKHAYPMGSIRKLKVLRKLFQWGVKNNVDRLEAKIDGVSLSIEKRYTLKVLTRGNGSLGGDLTSVFKDKFLKDTWSGIVRGELFITNAHFKLVSNDFKTPRNYVAGLLNKNAPDLSGTNLMIYDTIDFKGRLPFDKFILKIKGMPFFNRWDLFRLGYLRISKLREIYPIDGIVMKRTNSYSIINKYRRDAVCWKFTEFNSKKSRVKAIFWNVGRTGRLTPVLRIVPIIIDRRVIERVTLHNAYQAQYQRSGIASIVEIEQAGQTIPYLRQVIKCSKVMIPSNCPGCKSVLTVQLKDIKCTNVKCSAKLSSYIKFILSQEVLDIQELSYNRMKLINHWSVLLKFLADRRFRNYLLRRNLGLKIAIKVIKSFENCTLTLSKWLSLLNLDNLGSTWAKKIQKFYENGNNNFWSDLHNNRWGQVKEDLKLPVNVYNALLYINDMPTLKWYVMIWKAF